MDGLIAGVSGGGGGVSSPIELVDANTSIERYTNATKSNVSLDLSINETASAIRLINGDNDDTDTILNNYLLKGLCHLIMIQYFCQFLQMVFNYGEFQTMETQH